MNFAIELVKTSDLTQDQKNGLNILNQECGGAIISTSAFAYLLALDRTKIISSVPLFINNRVGTIGKVCVARDYKHHGIVSSMLKRALVVLKAESCDIASLTIDQEKKTYGVYEKLGFKISEDKQSIPGTMYINLAKGAI